MVRLSYRNKTQLIASATLFLACLSAGQAFAACTLSSPDTWNGSLSNDWSTGGNWDGGVPGGVTNACITNATNNPVTLNSGGSVASLQLGGANSLNLNATLSMSGPSLINDGAIALGSALELTGNVTLSGAGTLTMNGISSPTSGGQIGTNGGGWTLNNQSTIQGSGLIGSNAITFSNLNLNNSGTINGNVIGQDLVIGGTGSAVTNSGTFEATAFGTLGLSSQSAINNNGGLILSDSGTVNVSTTIRGGTLTTSNNGVMQTTASGATLDASSQGAITLTDGSAYQSTAGTTNITGQLNLGSVTGSTLALGSALELTGNTTLTGPGVVNITGNGNNSTGGQIGTNGSGWVLTNNSTIQGSGTIGSNAITFNNLTLANNGTINANTNGQVLAITGAGSSITNAGLFEATGGGTLNLATQAAITNNGANISAIGPGSTVNVATKIVGGTLNTSGGGTMQTTATGATLDASSQGAILLSDGSTYQSTAGTTNITGQLNLGTVTGSTLALGSALELTGNTTLTGPGVVNITGNGNNSTGGQIGTNGGGWTLTNNSTIQGSGTIGSNAITFNNLSLANAGTIDANTTGQVLAVTGAGSSIVNTGLLEATGFGTLTLTTQTAINNNGGNISAAGNGSTVNIGTTIQGGTLNTSGVGTMQTMAGGARLDALNQGAITLSDGSTYQAISGPTSILGQFNLGTVTGSTLNLGAALQLVGNTTLSGPGVVTMTGNPSAPAGAQIGTDGGGWVLTNQSTIQGSGLIGSNSGILFQNLNLSNSGTINANTNTAVLEIAGSGASIVNTGLLEATNGGILTLATSTLLNNGGGNITASGAGSTVNVTNTAIAGGTLNTTGGGVMQTVGNSLLAGGTANGAVTISDGSTYTSGAAAITRVGGQLALGTSIGGTLALGGQLELVNDTTLSGPGALVISGAGQIGTNGGGWILTNQSNITGTGLMGSSVGSLFNNGSVNNQGSIIADGGTLTVAEAGGITNTGTLQANAGSSLIVTAPVSGSTFSGNTLHTGTYNAFTGGTIQLNSLGTAGGEIHSNNGTILLDGPGASIVDGGSLDALSALSDNSGSFTIRNGRDFTSLSPFSNEGVLQIGSATTFFTGASGGGAYSQTSGTTTVDGTLDPLSVDILGGLIDGTGSIDGALTVDLGGVVTPGDAGSTGMLTDNGDFNLGSLGTLDIGIASGGNDFLDVNGQANLGGTLDLVALDGFTLASGDTFFLLEDITRNGTFDTIDTSGLNLGAGLTAQILYDQGAGNNEVELEINGTVSGTPEPGTWFLLAIGLGALVLLRRKVARA
jgi:fibronectin-binding autotransporter adhesin